MTRFCRKGLMIKDGRPFVCDKPIIDTEAVTGENFVQHAGENRLTLSSLPDM